MTDSRHTFALTIAMASALVIPGAAAAQQEMTAAALPLQFSAVLDCRAIKADEERLACYDRTVAALDSARAAKEIFVADKAQIQETKRGLFGYAMPKVPVLGDEDSEQINEITARVSASRNDANGRFILQLDNGSRWRQIETVDMRTPRTGDSIVIKRAALGSYMAKINNQRAFRVQRLTD